MFNKDTLNSFKKVTGFDIEALFGSFVSFIENDYPNITSYYEGTKSNTTESFKVLDDLKNRFETCLQLFIQNKKHFDDSLNFWDLLESIEDTKRKLNTITNYSKYYKSAVFKNTIVQGSTKEIVLNRNGTIEDVAIKELKSTNPKDDWIDIALANNTKEEDYKFDGKYLLKVIYNQSSEIYYLDTVMGPLEGELLYGKDINKKLTYINNDLEVLTPKETILQTIQVCLNLKRGDNPNYPSKGIQVNLLGNNISSFAYPTLFRQLSEVFATEDTISSFTVRDIQYVEDAVFLSFDIQTQYGTIYNDNIKL